MRGKNRNIPCRRLRSTLLAAIIRLGSVCALAGCGNDSGSDGGAASVRLMVWSPSEDQSRDSGEWLQTCCANFAAEHPEWDITFVYGIADEATAASSVAQDPEASADVFFYANDNITTLTDAQAVAKFGGKYEAMIKSDASEAITDSVTLDGYLYGVPFTSNTWFMYYDKRVFSEDDVKSLESMLEKGVISFPLTNSWYLPAFYFGNKLTDMFIRIKGVLPALKDKGPKAKPFPVLTAGQDLLIRQPVAIRVLIAASDPAIIAVIFTIVRKFDQPTQINSIPVHLFPYGDCPLKEIVR